MLLPRWIAGAASGAFLTLGFLAVPAHAEEPVKQAVCPVMGSTFKVTENTKHAMVNGQPVYFCCAGCPEAFAKEPEKYVAKAVNLTCPVMEGAPVKPNKALRVLVNDGYYYTCCAGCPAALAGSPERFITADLRDPVSGKTFKIGAKQPHVEHNGVHYFFASAESKATFEKAPAKYARKVVN